MCGIIGKVSTKKTLLQLEVESGLNCIFHRGPDGNGYWLNNDGTCYIGSTRLAIHDLSPSGKMPMHNAQQTVHIVLNGEVYNFLEIKKELQYLGHIFYSSSDTEVVLNAYLQWGINCLDKLNGMYAIAIVDENKQKLWLARDRVGEKPLYCFHNNQIFAFSSELKVFLQDKDIPNKLNYSALSEYLQYGYVSSSHALIEGVWQLKPGSYLELDTKTLKYQEKTYWHLPIFEKNDQLKSEVDFVDALENHLQESIKQQLLADVPVGIFLSGGVDSSLVTAIASKVSMQPVKTFHISMEDAPNLDERKYADIIAKHFNTEHNVLVANTLTFEKFLSIIETIDEPMADSSYIPTFMVCELARQYVTVALGGDGGDELFGGYNHYQSLQKISQKKANPLLTSLFSRLPIGLKGRNYILSQDKQLFKHGFKNFFDDSSIHSVISKDIKALIKPFQKGVYFSENDDDLVQSASRHDFLNYLPDDIMTKVDRAAMANSLETRAPMLDKNIIEFAYKDVPTHLKLNGDTKKYLLKALAKRILPKDFPLERKQGFSIPLTTWLNGKWKNPVRDILSSSNSGIFDTKQIIRLLDKEGTLFNNNNRIYAILLLVLWIRKYEIET